MFSGLAVPETIPVRRWTAIASFTLQALAVAVALMLPLLNPRKLPEALIASRHIFTPASGGEARTTANQSPGRSISALQAPLVVNQDLHVPVPQLGSGSDANQAPEVNSALGTGPSSIPYLGPSTHVLPMPQPPVAAAHTVRTSVMMEGNLIHRVEPVYPLIAKQAGIQGTVIVRALIGRAGEIEQAQVVSGPVLLGPAAVAAIRQWKYRPYVLNGSPIEVETQITVNFILRR